MINPEGTQSNGKYLLPFKRGAFESLKAVQPIVLKYKSNNGTMNVTWECLGFIEQTIIAFTAPCYYICTLMKLPPVKPTDYLFEKYADKGRTKAEIFAWVTREIMSKAGDIEKLSDQSTNYKDKALYKSFMTGKIDELEYNGKKFSAPTIHSFIPCLRKKKK